MRYLTTTKRVAPNDLNVAMLFGLTLPVTKKGSLEFLVANSMRWVPVGFLPGLVAVSSTGPTDM